MRRGLDHPVFLLALGLTGLLLAGFTRPAATSPAPAHPPASRTDGRPSRLPPRTWWTVLKTVVSRIGSDRLLTEAAGVTFYTLLALFPALAALISLYGLVADPASVADHLASLQGILPGGGMDILRDQIHALTSGRHGSLGVGLLFGLATSLWSANQGTKALFEALNVVHQETETRGFLRRTAITLLFTGGALLFLLLSMGAVVLVPVALDVLGLPGSLLGSLLAYARWPLLLLVVAVLLALVYRFGPSRDHAAWRLLSWGSAFASLSWLLASAGFSWYVAHFGSYNRTYGSLGAVVGFMTWIWISVVIVLIGAELNAELEQETEAAPPRRRSHEDAKRAASAG